jgi:putative transposase
MTQRSPFRYFKTSPEIIRLAVMLYVRYPPTASIVQRLREGTECLRPMSAPSALLPPAIFVPPAEGAQVGDR